MSHQFALGRYVNHDPRSRSFAFDGSALEVRSVRHRRVVPVFDQGYLGSCTGNAAVGCLGTEPFYETLPEGYTLDQDQAISVYSEATAIDPFPGAYPPVDTGSDGLSVAKVLKGRGLISGYTHAFSFADALKALTTQPVITGVNWYTSFFDPAPDGTVTITQDAFVAGGHEFILDEVDVERRRVGATNSWGEGWGLDGRFYLDFSTMERLLAERGDVTVFVPVTKPAPTPTPPVSTIDPEDVELWGSVSQWATSRRRGPNKRAAASIRNWATKKGL